MISYTYDIMISYDTYLSDLLHLIWKSLELLPSYTHTGHQLIILKTNTHILLFITPIFLNFNLITSIKTGA